MQIQHIHDWELTVAEARALQVKLQDRIVLTEPTHHISLVGAADVAYDKSDRLCFAVAVAIGLPRFDLLEAVSYTGPASFPYVPGLFSFREGPPLLNSLALLTRTPDVLLFDGHGVAHPRRLGLASHMGLFLGIPTIGCAKSRLVGSYREPGPRKQDTAPLVVEENLVGYVVRSRPGVKPIFVSPGHLIDAETALDVTLRCLGNTRVPEPLRQAHLLAARLRREYSATTAGRDR